MKENYRRDTVCTGRAGSQRTESREYFLSIRAQHSNMIHPLRWEDFLIMEESGYFYTRLANPTNDAVASKINDLEGGVGAMLTSSDRPRTTL